MLHADPAVTFDLSPSHLLRALSSAVIYQFIPVAAGRREDPMRGMQEELVDPIFGSPKDYVNRCL